VRYLVGGINPGGRQVAQSMDEKGRLGVAPGAVQVPILLGENLLEVGESWLYERRLWPVALT